MYKECQHTLMLNIVLLLYVCVANSAFKYYCFKFEE